MAVVVLSAHVEVEQAMDLLANGQRTGYLLKSRVTDVADFVDALHPALRALGRRSPIPVRVDIRFQQRLPEDVEVSAYYVVAEALTNAARHAGASTVRVEADATDGVLHIAIRDNGVGGASFTGGTGLAGLKDRVEALGGQGRLDSPPGAGTSLLVELPLSSTSGGVTSR